MKADVLTRGGLVDVRDSYQFPTVEKGLSREVSRCHISCIVAVKD